MKTTAIEPADDLLAACRNLLGFVSDGKLPPEARTPYDVIVEARDAIARTESGQPRRTTVDPAAARLILEEIRGEAVALRNLGHHFVDQAELMRRRVQAALDLLTEFPDPDAPEEGGRP